jgi:hypothetical protein
MVTLKFPQVQGDFNARATGVSTSGFVVGWLQQINPAGFDGFTRAKNGTITLFAGPPEGHGAAPAAVNDSGIVTGKYTDANYTFHGFLRDAQGGYTIFDPPGSIYTSGVGISASGTVAGTYSPHPGSQSGFRARHSWRVRYV